jgi:putative transposase
LPYWKTFYHVVWATAERQPLIAGAVEADLFAVMAATAQRLGCMVHALNGTPDHAHAVLSIPPAVAVSKVIGQMKGAGAHAVNQAGHYLEWHDGYGVFTLGERQLPRAVAYVRNQKQHHASGTALPSLERTAAG